MDGARVHSIFWQGYVFFQARYLLLDLAYLRVTCGQSSSQWLAYKLVDRLKSDFSYLCNKYRTLTLLQPFGPIDNATKASAFPTYCCAIGFGSRQNQSGKGWSEWLTFVSLLMSSVLARQLEIFSLDLWAKSNFPCSFLTDEAGLKSLMISSRPSILRTPLPFGASLSRGFNLVNWSKSKWSIGAIFFVTLKYLPFSGNDRFTGLQASDRFFRYSGRNLYKDNRSILQSFGSKWKVMIVTFAWPLDEPDSGPQLMQHYLPMLSCNPSDQA